jgi:hypothetical protein
MVNQLGYICMFAVCWPIAPVWSLVNNFVCHTCRLFLAMTSSSS